MQGGIARRAIFPRESGGIFPRESMKMDEGEESGGWVVLDGGGKEKRGA